jgi:hypothetical protein
VIQAMDVIKEDDARGKLQKWSSERGLQFGTCFLSDLRVPAFPFQKFFESLFPVYAHLPFHSQKLV